MADILSFGRIPGCLGSSGSHLTPALFEHRLPGLWYQEKLHRPLINICVCTQGGGPLPVSRGEQRTLHFLMTGAGCWGIITLSEHAALTAAARTILNNVNLFTERNVGNKINILHLSLVFPLSFPPQGGCGLGLPWQVWSESSWDAVSSPQSPPPVCVSPLPSYWVSMHRPMGGRHGGKLRLETEIKLDKWFTFRHVKLLPPWLLHSPAGRR